MMLLEKHLRAALFVDCLFADLAEEEPWKSRARSGM